MYITIILYKYISKSIWNINNIFGIFFKLIFVHIITTYLSVISIIGFFFSFKKEDDEEKEGINSTFLRIKTYIFKIGCNSGIIYASLRWILDDLVILKLKCII